MSFRPTVRPSINVFTCEQHHVKTIPRNDSKLATNIDLPYQKTVSRGAKALNSTFRSQPFAKGDYLYNYVYRVITHLFQAVVTLCKGAGMRNQDLNKNNEVKYINSTLFHKNLNFSVKEGDNKQVLGAIRISGHLELEAKLELVAIVASMGLCGPLARATRPHSLSL